LFLAQATFLTVFTADADVMPFDFAGFPIDVAREVVNDFVHNPGVWANTV